MIVDVVVSAVIIVVGALVIGYLGSITILRLERRSRLEIHNQTTLFIFGQVAGLYAFLLGFAVAEVWQAFEAADSQTRSEAAAISNLLEDAVVFRPNERAVIRRSLLTYTNNVVNHEFRSLANAQTDSVTARQYNSLWQKYYSFHPVGHDSDLFYSESLGQLNDLDAARRLRILQASATVPTPVWVLLIIGGLVTLLFTYMYLSKDVKRQRIAIGGLATLLGFVLFLIYSLQRPFTGDIKVEPTAYKQVLTVWKSRQL